jgi:hypothetical protein
VCLEYFFWGIIGKEVSCVLNYLQCITFYPLSKKVTARVNMLRPLVMTMIICQLYCSYIITRDIDWEM